MVKRKEGEEKAVPEFEEFDFPKRVLEDGGGN